MFRGKRQLCVDKGHKIQRVKVTERYFNCNKCGVHQSVIGAVLPKACRSCGSKSFKAASMLRVRAPTCVRHRAFVGLMSCSCSLTSGHDGTSIHPHTRHRTALHRSLAGTSHQARKRLQEGENTGHRARPISELQRILLRAAALLAEELCACGGVWLLHRGAGGVGPSHAPPEGRIQRQAIAPAEPGILLKHQGADARRANRGFFATSEG